MANGPAWHDKFPTLEFDELNQDSFASKDRVVEYFEEFAKKIKAPIMENINVFEVTKGSKNNFLIQTSDGEYEAKNVIAATGAFQEPVIPRIIPHHSNLEQLHSKFYKNPEQLKKGAVLVVGSGSSGSQIAEELNKANKEVYFSKVYTNGLINYRFSLVFVIDRYKECLTNIKRYLTSVDKHLID